MFDPDAQGSIRLLSDADGVVRESYAYDTYGKPYVMASAGADGNWLTEDVATYSSSVYDNPYLFTARRWNDRTQLYYHRFRDYTPLLGRFVQTDPAGYIDTMNLYAYCANNPVNWIDPWGLAEESPKDCPIQRLVEWVKDWFRNRHDQNPVFGSGGMSPAEATGGFQNHHLIPWNNSRFGHHNHQLMQQAGWGQDELENMPEIKSIFMVIMEDTYINITERYKG